MKNKIYIKQWLDLKPYHKQCPTDTYYLRLANEIRESFQEFDILDQLLDITNEDTNILACILASYFEDIISETNIWNTFVKLHTRMYGKPIPFLPADNYYDGEINQQDIHILIWYFFNTIQDDTHYQWYAPYIEEVAGSVMEILEREYETAPENLTLKAYYWLDDDADYYAARSFMQKLFLFTYLFYTDTYSEFRRRKEALIRKGKDHEEYLQIMKQGFFVFYIHTAHSRLLSLKANEWAAHILGEDHPLHKNLLGLSPRIEGYFQYKGMDDTNVFIEHIASGKKFNLVKHSFDSYTDLNEIDTLIFIGIIRWGGEWWFSGVFIKSGFDADLVLDQKNSIEARLAVNFLDEDKEKTDEVVEKQRKAFLSFNKGQPIAFMPTNKVEDFTKGFAEHYNNSLQLSAKEKEEASQRARKDGFFGDIENQDFDLSGGSDTALVFFNPISGIELATGINSAFPMEHNPYFNKNKSEADVSYSLMSPDVSVELAKYCVDNCKDKLDFFKGEEGMTHLNDMDFLLRFWKKDNYHTTSHTALTG